VTAKILQLIDKFDNVELVRDQVAAILVVESEKQRELAAAATEDPELWRLRVFVERSNPWDEFLHGPDQHVEDSAPIVHVAFDNSTADLTGTDHAKQKFTGVFHIDCYGYGISTATVEGHEPGDEKAAFEAQRAVRLVRNILTAAHYAYLDMRTVVGRRWVQSVTMFQPAIEGRSVQHVIAARLALHVEFNEFSPQVQGEPLELIAGTVKRKETGEVLLKANYQF
jgi:hypothetical protein